MMNVSGLLGFWRRSGSPASQMREGEGYLAAHGVNNHSNGIMRILMANKTGLGVQGTFRIHSFTVTLFGVRQEDTISSGFNLTAVVRLCRLVSPLRRQVEQSCLVQYVPIILHLTETVKHTSHVIRCERFTG